MDLASLQIYGYLSTGFYFLAMMVEVVGFLVCLAFRHLTGWMIVVATGFAGLFAAGVLSRLMAMRWLLGDSPEWLMGPLWVVGAGCHFLSMIAVVGGLWMTLVALERRLALALEPKDGWR
jgi:hypothetical protein